MTSNRRRGVAFAFACLGILGVMPLLANARPATFDGLTFTIWLTFWQLVCALPLTVREFAAGQRGILGAELAAGHRGRTALIALATGVMFGLSTYLYVVSAEKAGPVSMAIAIQAYPLFVILWEALFLGKRKSQLELAFTGLIIVALAYLTTNGTFSIAGVSWWSVFALGIPLLWSIAHILLKGILDTTPITPNQVTVSRLVISGAFLLALAFAFGDPAALGAGLADFDFQRAAFVLGFAYYLELILWFHAIRHIDVSLASSVTVPTPAVTMLAAVIFTGATVELHQVLAMVAIATGVYGLLYAGRRASRPAPA